jgi:hypothetical protein
MTRPGKPVRITWNPTPPSPAQLVAWRHLWDRLLSGHVKPAPETRQPQEESPGAIDGATVSSGHNLLKEQDNDSTHHTLST